MNKTQMNNERRPGLGSALWSGLLLGLLLTIFLAALVYATYLFVAWGQDVAASAPKLPPLALPQLVRLAPAAPHNTTNNPLGLLSQPAASRNQEAAPTSMGRVTVLLMGVDNRPDEAIARTDSIMVLTINPKTGSAGMISLARDLLVDVPGAGIMKINTAHFVGESQKYPGGGPELLRRTVANLLGYPIDYYVRINFDGFRQIIDLIGGIEIDVPQEIRDDEYPDENYGYDPLYIPAGRQFMNGALALKYARTRHLDFDYGRARRQQQIILAVKDKVMQPGQLAALLPRLPALALAMANSIQTDMPIEKAIALARAAGQMDLSNPARVVIDNTMGLETNHETLGFVLVPDMPKIRAAAANVFADAPAGPSAEELARQRMLAENARIVILNGTTQDGVAARMQAVLVAEGYNIVAIGNADRSGYAETLLVSYGDTKPLTREALIRRFGLSAGQVRSLPAAPNADLAIIVGADQAAKLVNR